MSRAFAMSLLTAVILSSSRSVLVVSRSGSQDQAPPRFRTEANYVRVDMYPTRDGIPVADLRQDDVELLENGIPQQIEQFEHVVIRRGEAPATRPESNTVAAARQVPGEPRARLVVLFL